jgi:hypothetical protein
MRPAIGACGPGQIVNLRILACFLMLLAAPAYAAGPSIYYPDLKQTPGAVLTHDPKVLCKVGYTTTVRHVPASEAKQVFKNYGIDYSRHSGYEVDHLISLELGGSNDIKNLWPQKYCPPAQAGKICFGAREKDVVETDLHRRICRGTVTVQKAQAIITRDWYKEYLNIKKEGKKR